MSKFRARLDANARDFDGIVMDMLDEMTKLRNKKREYKHRVQDARNELVDAIMEYGEQHWTQETTHDILRLVDLALHSVVKGK